MYSWCKQQQFYLARIPARKHQNAADVCTSVGLQHVTLIDSDLVLGSTLQGGV
jgi:hypothetical protein